MFDLLSICFPSRYGIIFKTNISSLVQPLILINHFSVTANWKLTTVVVIPAKAGIQVGGDGHSKLGT